MNEIHNLSESKKENYDSEIDKSLLKLYSGCIKIFTSDKKQILKFSKRLTIIGSIVIIISWKSFLSLMLGYFRLGQILIFLGLFLLFSAYYLRKNSSKFALIIVYKDKVLFKKKKYFGRLEFLNLLYLYSSKKFDCINKSELKNAVIPKGVLRQSNLYFESYLDNTKTHVFINTDKNYLNQIVSYLNNYIKNK